MRKTILTFGLISGAISAALMSTNMLLANKVSYDHGLYLGYTVIVLSMLLVYFGIRSYRDNVGEGQITFGRAFAVGLGITVISCLLYVAAWEILYFNFLPGFMDKYGAHEVQKLTAAGASPAAIQAKVEQFKKYREMYDNPLMNAAMTFIEPFPVGLLMTLISSVMLRKKRQGQGVREPAAA